MMKALGSRRSARAAMSSLALVSQMRMLAIMAQGTNCRVRVMNMIKKGIATPE